MKCNKCGSAMAFSHVHIDLDTEKATTYFKCYHCKRLWPEIENNDAGVVATSPAKDGGPAEPAEPVSMPEWEQLRLDTQGQMSRDAQRDDPEPDGEAKTKYWRDDGRRADRG